MGDVIKLLKGHNVEINSVVTKYKKTHIAFAENFNKSLEEILFGIMDAKAMQSGEKNNEWVKKSSIGCSG